jgi:SAM-dependent methyltransferase
VPAQPDPQRVQAFTNRLTELYTASLLTLMIDIGYRTGLFEAAAQGPATSQALADRAGLQERYVREWLGAVTCGDIFAYDPATQTYTLPPEHAACLAGQGGANIAPRSQNTAYMARTLPRLADCFRQGGGVPYADFRPHFTDMNDANWRRFHDQWLIRGILPVAHGLPERLRAGLRAADVGCGTGHNVNLMAREYPASAFTGYDIAEDAIARARAEAAAMGLRNARFEVLDVTRLPLDPELDLVTSFDSIHDQRDPAAVLRRIYEVLAPGGVYLMFEPRAFTALEDNLRANPYAAHTYSMSVLHCLTVSLAEGGAGLGTAWGEQLARQMLSEAGFTQVELFDSPRPQNYVFVSRKV